MPLKVLLLVRRELSDKNAIGSYLSTIDNCGAVLGELAII